jgi:centrin-1
LAVDLSAEGQGSITFEEFIHLMTPRLLEGDSRENVDRIFALFDTGKTGFISVTDLRRIAHEVGGDISEQDL